MTNEQIEEGNKLILQFLKSEYGSNATVAYHNDWNGLMSAVQIIQASGYKFYLESNEESVKARFADMGIPERIVVEVVDRNSNLSAVWNLCVAFAKWRKSQYQ